MMLNYFIITLSLQLHILNTFSQCVIPRKEMGNLKIEAIFDQKSKNLRYHDSKG